MSDVAVSTRSPSPLRLFVWVTMLVAVAVAIQAAVGFGFAFTPDRHVSRLALTATSTLLLHLTLIGASLWWGRRVGHGDVWAGLGFVPIRRRRLLLILALVSTPIALAWVGLIIRLGLMVTHPSALAGQVKTMAHADWGYVVLLAVVAGLIAPVSEEMIFRGWLWTGLRRSWQPLPVALVTSGLWLLGHMPDGVERPLFLLPMAVVVSVARSACGSTRATLAIHMVNNMAVIAVVGVALWRAG